jgi:hypothetical protein
LGVSYIGVQKLDRWEHMSADWWRLNRLERYSQVNDQQLLDDLLILSNDPIVGLCGGLKSLIDKR